jgi:hypothetical protein
MRLPLPPANSCEALLTQLTFLVWTLESSHDLDTLPPTHVLDTDGLSPDEIQTLRLDYLDRKKQIIQGVMSSVYQGTVAEAHEILRKIVKASREDLDGIGEPDPIFEAPESRAERALLRQRITLTVIKALKTLPEESPVVESTTFEGLTDKQARALKMAIAISEKDPDWESAGEPPAGQRYDTWALRV